MVDIKPGEEVAKDTIITVMLKQTKQKFNFSSYYLRFVSYESSFCF